MWFVRLYEEIIHELVLKFAISGKEGITSFSCLLSKKIISPWRAISFLTKGKDASISMEVYSPLEIYQQKIVCGQTKCDCSKNI